MRRSMELVRKIQEAIGDGYCLIIINKKCCINKDCGILLGFDYFDVGVNIYLWRRSLTLVVGTASVMLTDSVKQAGLVVVIG